MKLLTKTSYYYLILSALLFLVGAGLFYFYISRLLNEEINEQLEIEQKRVLTFIEETGTLPKFSPLNDNKYIFLQEPGPVRQRFRDTIFLSPLLDEQLPYRCLIFPVIVDKQYYTVFIHRPLIEKDDLLQVILKSLGLFMVFLVGLLFLLNRWLSGRLWNPFYQTLQQLKTVDLKEAVLFPNVETQEFNELHQELNRMVFRINQQYRNLKEFTENASHELQTPLAIIQSNLEMLLQSEYLPEADRQKISATYESANRLSKLYQSLLLLSKIENYQFTNVQPCSIGDTISTTLQLFDELLAFKNISVEVDIQSSAVIEMDKYLSEVLISNLIGNAIRHCPNKGIVQITLHDCTLSIVNTGPPMTLPEDRLFQRFSKGMASGNSSGLGLAIVQQICAIYGLTILYTYDSSLHHFIVKF